MWAYLRVTVAETKNPKIERGWCIHCLHWVFSMNKECTRLSTQAVCMGRVSCLPTRLLIIPRISNKWLEPICMWYPCSGRLFLHTLLKALASSSTKLISIHLKRRQERKIESLRSGGEYAPFRSVEKLLSTLH